MDEARLIEDVLDALRRQGLDVRAPRRQPAARGGLRPDAVVRIGKDRAYADFVVEAKRGITPATLGAAVAQLGHLAAAWRMPGLLVADYVAPPAAEWLRARRQAFADAVGNAFLEGNGLLVDVAGRKPIKVERAGKAFTPGGLKVLFALICDPTLGDAPHRTIAKAAGVALGTVPAVLGDLQRTGRLLVAGKRRRLHATKRLLDEWAHGYAQQLQPRTLLAAYRAPGMDTWATWPLDAGARWGGEPAANLLVGKLKPGMLTLYADRLPPRLMVAQRLAMAAARETGPLLEVRRPFWGDGLRNETDPRTVPPALVYADLLATGEARCLETAAIVHERHLARLFPAR